MNTTLSSPIIRPVRVFSFFLESLTGYIRRC
jgi:hypothetical protein